MNNLELSMRLLKEYLESTPKQELNRIADELITKYSDSPTVSEYLNLFETEYYNLLLNSEIDIDESECPDWSIRGVSMCYGDESTPLKTHPPHLRLTTQHKKASNLFEAFCYK